MSNPKYKLLLWVVALMVLAIPLYAADVGIWSEDFEAVDAADNWTLSSGSDWGIGVPTGPSAATADGSVLAYKLAGNYANSITSLKYARSEAIDCTDQVGAKLLFSRFLQIEDSHFDKAIVEVSNDGTAWEQVWMNPSESNGESGDDEDWILDTLDTAWTTVEYDISEVADGQETVYIRFGLSSSAADNFDGWNIDNIEVTASAPDALYSWTNAQVGTLWNLGAASNGTAWAVGPAVAWAGVDVDADLILEGGDPGDDPAGVAGGTIIGTNIGAAYTVDMDPIYLTSPAFDLTGYSGTAVRYQRVLGVLDGAYDLASVQVQIDDDPDTGAFEDVECWVAEDVPVTLVEEEEHVWEVPTPEFYDVTFTLDYNTNAMAATGDDFYIEISPNGEAPWTQLGHITTSTDNDVDDGVVTFESGNLPLGFDNGSFFIRARMNAAADAGTVIVSDVTVSGQNWKYGWKNAANIPAEGVYDEDWTETTTLLDADGAANVRVRFALGITGGFPTKPGGWSLSDLEIIEASREFRPMGVETDAELVWGEEGSLTATLKNTGTATWDSSFSAFEAVGVYDEVADPGNPILGEDIPQLTLGSFPVSRWAVDSIAVGDDDTVAPDEGYDFGADVVAPKLSAVVYAAPFEPTAPADVDLSVLHADFALGNETVVADPEAVKAYMDLSKDQVARGNVVVTRFPDDAPSNAAGAWARYYIEELAGAVPFIAGGYPNGTYRPAVVVDRASIAVYIQRAAKVPTTYAVDGHLGGAPGTTPLGTIFYDVPDDHWAGMQIQACFNADIIIGYPDNTYHPASTVTRDQMCKFIVNGVNFAHVGAITVPTLASLTQDAYPFEDVVAEDDPDTADVNEQNPLANFVLAAADSAIVLGYPVPPDAEEGTKPNFKPADSITRDQLAVFVWRGFLRGTNTAQFPAVVALGGPGFTQAITVGDLDLTGCTTTGSIFADGGVPAFSGFTELTDIIQTGDVATAYVTFDAARINGRASALPVVFALSEGATATDPTTVSVSAAQIAAWVADLEAQVVEVEPYKTVALPIDTDDLDHGIYTLTVTVDTYDLTLQPSLKIMGQIMIEDFEGGFPTSGWEVSGQPGTMDLFGDDVDEDVAADWDDVIDGDFSIRMVETQAVSFGQDTSNRHNIQLNMDIAGADLTDADTLSIWYSKDSGATWILAGDVITGDAIPSELDTISFDLPNGLEFTDPDAWADLSTEEQEDPDNWGADNITGFMVKIGVDLSEDGSVFVDNIELRGT